MAVKKKPKSYGRKGKETINIPMTITVEGHESDLNVKLDFNHSKGTYKLTTAITTKQISMHNDKVNAAVLTNVKGLLEQGIALATEMREAWGDGGSSSQVPLIDFKGKTLPTSHKD